MPCSPGKQAAVEGRRLSYGTSSTRGTGDPALSSPGAVAQPPQVIVHGNGFPFLCSIVLFAVTAERFACAITHPCIYPRAHSGVAASLGRPRAAPLLCL